MPKYRVKLNQFQEHKRETDLFIEAPTEEEANSKALSIVDITHRSWRVVSTNTQEPWVKETVEISNKDVTGPLHK